MTDTNRETTPEQGQSAPAEVAPSPPFRAVLQMAWDRRAEIGAEALRLLREGPSRFWKTNFAAKLQVAFLLGGGGGLVAVMLIDAFTAKPVPVRMNDVAPMSRPLQRLEPALDIVSDKARDLRAAAPSQAPSSPAATAPAPEQKAR